MIKTPLSTVIGGAFWTPSATILGGASKTLNQIIKPLFANNEQGFAYDPNDLTTMFQDAAGIIPVTGAGQPVGLMLDKSKGLVSSQNMLPQASFSEGTAGWVLQSGWTKSGDKVSNTTGATALESPLTLEVGKLYRITLNTRRIGEAGTLSIRSGVTLDTQMVAASVNGIQTFLLRPTVSTNTLRFQSSQWLGDIYSVHVVEILGNHAYQTTSASRPILQRNATTGAYYLAFDGADDFFVVNNFDLTGTSELSLFAGVRLNSSAVGMLLETSANSTNTTGAFGIYAPHISATIRLQDFKSVLRFVSSPNSFVAGQYVLSAKLSQIKQVLRLNDVEVLETRVDTGNYSNHPLYIGRRGGTSFPFNGHLYSLIGIGRLTTDAETVALEKLIAKNTGVTLSV